MDKPVMPPPPCFPGEPPSEYDLDRMVYPHVKDGPRSFTISEGAFLGTPKKGD